MKKFIRKFIMFICLCVFIYSAYNLIKIGYTYYMLDKTTKDMVHTYIKEPTKKTNSYQEAIERKIDFVSLKKRNPDVIGWIYIPDTAIDEVVLKGANNDTYLRHTIDHEYNVGGQVFIDEINSKNFTDMNTIVYGHNMFNGSRFGALENFTKKQSYFDKHKNVFIYTPDGKVYVYDIYAAKVLNAYSHLYTNQVDYKKYIQEFMKDAAYTRNISNKKAPLLMLSTCTSSDNDDRYVLSARLKKMI